MAKKTASKDMKCGDWKCCGWTPRTKCGGGVYCMGFIGAVVYYVSTATGFWMGVLGVLKALVWPTFVVYGLLKFLGM